MFTTRSGLVLPGTCAAPKVAKLDGLHIFARNGRVQLERVDKQENKINSRSCTTKQAKARVQALGEQLTHMRTLDSYDRGTARTLERFIVAFEEAIKQAEAQGPFEYPDMRRARLRSAPKTIATGKSC